MEKISLIILSIILISLPLIASAAGLVPCGGSGEPACQFCHLFEMFKRVVNFLLTYIVPPLAVLMIAIGGFMYVFAYLSPAEALPGGGKGGPSLISQAKRLLTSVVFGLMIIFGAWLLVNFFFQMIGVQKWTGLQSGWWQIKDCPTTSSQQQLANVNLNSAQQVLSSAIANQFQNPGNSALSSSQLKDFQMFMNAWQATGQQPSGNSIGPNSGMSFSDLFNKAQGINLSGPNQMDTMQSVLSQMGQTQTFNSNTAQNNFNFMSQLANSLNYNQGLVAQSQGLPFSNAGKSASPDINIAYIDQQVQNADGSIVTYGKTTDGLKAVIIEKNGVTTMSAMDANGNLVKMTTIDQYGNIQNLTGKFDSFGNLLLTGNGSQNFSGNISAANVGNIGNSMSSFLGQITNLSNIFNSGSTLTQGNVSNLFNSAMGFENSLFAGLNNTPLSIVSQANAYNISVPQMTSLSNNMLFGALNFVASKYTGGTLSPSMLSSFSSSYGQKIGSVINLSGLSGSSQMAIQNSIGSMQNLIKSPSFATLLNTTQGQNLLKSIGLAQGSIQTNGTVDQSLLNQVQNDYIQLEQMYEYEAVMASNEAYAAINTLYPDDFVFTDYMSNLNSSAVVGDSWYQATDGSYYGTNAELADPSSQFMFGSQDITQPWAADVNGEIIVMPAGADNPYDNADISGMVGSSMFGGIDPSYDWSGNNNLAATFEGMNLTGGMNTSAIINSASSLNLSAPQTNTLFNNTLFGALNFVASKYTGGTLSPSMLSSFSSSYGQIMNGVLSAAGLSGSPLTTLQKSVSSIQNLIKSPPFKTLLNTTQGQNLLKSLGLVQSSIQANGVADQNLLNQIQNDYIQLEQMSEYKSVMDSQDLAVAAGDSYIASQAEGANISGWTEWDTTGANWQANYSWGATADDYYSPYYGGGDYSADVYDYNYGGNFDYDYSYSDIYSSDYGGGGYDYSSWDDWGGDYSSYGGDSFDFSGDLGW